MKKIIILFLLLSNIVVGQSINPLGLNFRSNTKDTHIVTLSKTEPILVDMLIDHPIEINGHITKEKFYFKATLSGIEIYDKNKSKYTRRLCNEKECKLVHLQNLNYGNSNLGLFNSNILSYGN